MGPRHRRGTLRPAGVAGGIAEHMQTRPRRDDDLPALRHIVELTRTIDSYPPHWPPTMDRFPKARSELAAHVAVSDNETPLGHVALHGPDADSAALAASAATGLPAAKLAVVARLFVHPDQRRKGAARLLLGRAVADAHDLGLQPILDVWDRLGPAIAFYEGSGWTRIAAITIDFRSPCTGRCVHQGSTIDSFVYAGPSAAPQIRSGTWLLDLVAAVDHLRRGIRPGITVSDAIEEALRWHTPSTDGHDPDEPRWDDPDPLRGTLTRFLDHTTCPTSVDAQIAMRHWILAMAARYNDGHHWSHPASRRSFPHR